MTNNTNIPFGYQLHITTWENDADAYNTQIISGLFREEVEFFLNIAKKFNSKNDFKNPGLGNDCIDEESLVKVIKDAIDKFPLENLSGLGMESSHVEEFKEELKLLEGYEEEGEYHCEALHSLLCDKILSYADYEGYEPLFCRVYSDHKVYFYPNEIVDVTKDFE